MGFDNIKAVENKVIDIIVDSLTLCLYAKRGKAVANFSGIDRMLLIGKLAKNIDDIKNF